MDLFRNMDLTKNEYNSWWYKSFTVKRVIIFTALITYYFTLLKYVILSLLSAFFMKRKLAHPSILKGPLKTAQSSKYVVMGYPIQKHVVEILMVQNGRLKTNI